MWHVLRGAIVALVTVVLLSMLGPGSNDRVVEVEGSSSSSMADVYKGELTPLKRHIAFFDCNKDDAIYPSETYQGIDVIIYAIQDNIVRPNLNIGMDLWTDSPVKAETSGQGEINAATHSHHGSTLSMMDERELKRERRKQSNRESARRSRLRKQQECEELAQKVTDLTVVNGMLRSELDELKKACEDMEAVTSMVIKTALVAMGSGRLTQGSS
ncbi:Putative bZIP transcription factor superfamily protein [Zea mays]|nr:Putative bZIP transcription factor superfamily protein [Zea mays]